MIHNKRLFRSGWVKYFLLVLLVGVGVVAGLCLSMMPSAESDQGGDAWPTLTAAKETRFPLSPSDIKDTVEAPDLAADATGGVFVTWGSKTGATERTVFFTRTLDGGRAFDPPKPIRTAGVYKSKSHSEGKAGGYERRSSPHFGVAGKKIQLAWSEALPDGSAMRMLLAESTDAGATFSAGRPVHRAERPNATFTGLAVSPGGNVVCTWLGDQGGSQQPYSVVRPAGADWFDPEILVHAGSDALGVCPCCPTAACFAADGTLFVAFRNIQDGFRDIAVARLRPGQSGFESPFPVVGNTWKFDGCPHDGPSLVVVDGTLHIVWMDAHTGPQRCYYGRASLADMRFDIRELHPEGPGTQGNAKLFAAADGGVHVVWEESLGVEAASTRTGHQHGPPKLGSGGGRAIQYARIAPGQTAFGPVTAVAPRVGAFQNRPCITRTATGAIFIAWNELDESGKAVVVTALPQEPRAAP
jgi:hypothetical protein